MGDTNTFITFFFKPFFLGLYSGLILCVVVFIRMRLGIHELKAELKKLKQHLQTKLEIDAESIEDKKAKFEKLKEENENLRVSLQSVNTKPGRKEVRQFHIYQKALDIMFEKAPGFAPAWQNALREGDAEMKKIDKGFIPFIKRLSGGSISEGASESLPDKSGNRDNDDSNM